MTVLERKFLEYIKSYRAVIDDALENNIDSYTLLFPGLTSNVLVDSKITEARYTKAKEALAKKLDLAKLDTSAHVVFGDFLNSYFRELVQDTREEPSDITLGYNSFYTSNTINKGLSINLGSNCICEMLLKSPFYTADFNIKLDIKAKQNSVIDLQLAFISNHVTEAPELYIEGDSFFCSNRKPSNPRDVEPINILSIKGDTKVTYKAPSGSYCYTFVIPEGVRALGLPAPRSFYCKKDLNNSFKHLKEFLV
jgi:hypothetical protein